MGGGSNIGDAINYAADEVFSAKFGARYQVRRIFVHIVGIVAVVITIVAVGVAVISKFVGVVVVVVAAILFEVFSDMFGW